MVTLRLPDEMTYLKVIPDFKCSRGCHYCYNVLLGQEMSGDADKILATLDEVLAQVPRPIWVELIGGEPLELPARDLTFEILKRLQGHAKCRGVVLSTAVASPALLRRVLPLVRRVYLSIDLSNSRQNRKRLSQRQMDELGRLFDSAEVDLYVTGVLYGDETAEELREFIVRLSSAGIRSVGLTHRTTMPLTPAEIEGAIGHYYELFRLRLAGRSQVEIAGTILDSIELHLRGGLRKGPCECGRNSVAIEPDGRIRMGLCFDHRRDRIEAEDFQVIRSERPKHLREHDLCGSCALWDVCHGGCVSEAIRIHGTPYARASVHCEILRGVAQRVEEDVRHLARS
jgi:radical SAM protein with 4Fe4S-binding SPASM domain